MAGLADVPERSRHGDAVSGAMKLVSVVEPGHEHLMRVRAALHRVEYPGYHFTAHERSGMVYVKAQFMAPCAKTGDDVRQTTRRWLIRPDATEMEIVQTLFKLVLTSVEHEARENFKWRGRAVLGPHMDLDQLWEAAA